MIQAWGMAWGYLRISVGRISSCRKPGHVLGAGPKVSMATNSSGLAAVKS